jgi:SPP1 family predicted phage head-tail adaptor
VQPNQLVNRITIETLDYSTDAAGERIPVWSVSQMLWARILPLTGRDLAFAHSFDGTVSHQIVLRYTAGLLGPPGRFRVTYQGRFFHVKAVLNRDEKGTLRSRGAVADQQEILTPPLHLLRSERRRYSPKKVPPSFFNRRLFHALWE